MGVQWQAWGTTVRVDVTDPRAEPSARRIVARCVAEAERAADADRPDARVHRLLLSNGIPLPVPPVLSALVVTALDAAESSHGLVDPTVGPVTIPLRRARAAGRRRPAAGTFPVCSALPVARPRPAVGWRAVGWTERRIAMPAGTALDLTATAKARTARLAAARLAEQLGVGSLVELGGDVAAAGPAPAHGWLVSPRHLGSAVVELEPGMSLAACRSAGIVDPATGRPVASPWQAVAVAAPDVVLAKAAAVAALVHGTEAEAYLEGRGLAAVFRRPLHAPGTDAAPRPGGGSALR